MFGAAALPEFLATALIERWKTLRIAVFLDLKAVLCNVVSEFLKSFFHGNQSGHQGLYVRPVIVFVSDPACFYSIDMLIEDLSRNIIVILHRIAFPHL